MSPEEHAKGVERHCSAIVNAVMAAAAFDNEKCAFSLAAASLLVIGFDQPARTALARLMLRLAEELDHGVSDAPLMLQ
jgi:hypothetical protein